MDHFAGELPRVLTSHCLCRFAENPLVVNEPFIRFYAGAPLVTSTGHRLGSLCIIDRKPRELEAESCNVLINFAEIIVRELEKEQMRVRGWENRAKDRVENDVWMLNLCVHQLVVWGVVMEKNGEDGCHKSSSHLFKTQHVLYSRQQPLHFGLLNDTTRY